MSYGYGMMEDALEGALTLGGFSFFSGGLVRIAVYVFTALSLYTIASRRQISKAWLAWIPVVNVWILGALSDQYRYIVNREVRGKRKWLLGLSIVQTVLYAIILVFGFLLAGNMFFGLMNGLNQHQLLGRIMGHVLSILALCLPMLCIAVAKAILYYMALYDVYTSCERKNNVIYLVLSILPGVSTITKPLFLFLCRDKDEGMPPRQQPKPVFTDGETPVWEQPEEAPEAYAEEDTEE